MAAAYAAVVPVLEIPSGILADRWSRRGVLLLAGGCGLLSVLVAALSAGVTSYIVSAMILGAFFALQSGTVDSIVYDTLLEETGSADGYEKHFGRIQMWNSAALTGSALLGGVLAGLTSPRLTYVITLPCPAPSPACCSCCVSASPPCTGGRPAPRCARTWPPPGAPSPAGLASPPSSPPASSLPRRCRCCSSSDHCGCSRSVSRQRCSGPTRPA